MTRTINCGSCGGSGFRAGTYGDILCIDCEGEGSWETADEETISSVTLADCRRLYGEQPELDQLTECLGDPFGPRARASHEAASRLHHPASPAIAKRKVA